MKGTNCKLEFYYKESNKTITLHIRWFGWNKVYTLVRENCPDKSLKQLVFITATLNNGAILKGTKLYVPK